MTYSDYECDYSQFLNIFQIVLNCFPELNGEDRVELLLDVIEEHLKVDFRHLPLKVRWFGVVAISNNRRSQELERLERLQAEFLLAQMRL